MATDTDETVVLNAADYTTLAGGGYVTLDRPGGARWRLAHEDYDGKFAQEADWHVGLDGPDIAVMAAFGLAVGSVTFMADAR